MSALTDRIAEVLHETLHATGFDYHAAAEAVAAELQLTEEWGFHDPNDPLDDEPNGWCAAADYEGMTSRPVSHRRWVSAWSAVEEKP